jgi:hypothetical protein
MRALRATGDVASFVDTGQRKVYKFHVFAHIETVKLVGAAPGAKANHPGCDDFARLDGFRDCRDMLAWFDAQYGSEHFIGRLKPFPRAARSTQHDGGSCPARARKCGSGASDPVHDPVQHLRRRR